MKRALLAISLLVCTATQAQRLDPTAPLKSYAARVLPQCPGGVLTLEQAGPGPTNFSAFVVTVRSTDQYCGGQKYLLFSPKTQQVLIGTVIPLPDNGKPTGVRVGEKAAEMLKQKLKATVAPFPLPDGLKSVAITHDTPYGAFSYYGFVDQSEQFLIVGFRGNLANDPGKALRETLGSASAMRRGNASSKVEILELSDFQCPTCAAAHAKIEPLIKANLSKVNYVRLDLPLFEHHEWALPAAMGARAIQHVDPSKYWQYVDYVFKNQEDIGKRPSFDAFFKEYASDHDLDWPALEKVYASKSERQALLEQVSRAFGIGIASTPTFVVNGQIMGFGPDGSFTIDAIKGAIGTAQPAAKKSAK